MNERQVVFLVFDGMKQLDVTGPAEVFAEANRLGTANGPGAAYALSYVSPDGRPVRTSIGAEFPVRCSVAEVVTTDIAVIPGADHLPTAPVDTGLVRATARLCEIASRAVSVCTGAFLLAAAGVLDDRRATTHWAHAATLARGYPRINVSADDLFVRDGKFHTSAGVTAGIDLALSLVESDHGADLAREVARQLVVYMQRQGGQSQFSTLLQLPRGTHDDVRRATDAVAADPAAAHTVVSLAHIAGVTPRHLGRLFRTEIGTTPRNYIEQVRLETAKSLLLHGEAVERTARRAGFGSAETMRRVFLNHVGMPPRTFRERFASTLR